LQSMVTQQAYHQRHSSAFSRICSRTELIFFCTFHKFPHVPASKIGPCGLAFLHWFLSIEQPC
jgi:hypothetical protein